MNLEELASQVRGKYRVAAACYDKKGRVISYGTNSYTKTHPKQLQYAREAGCESKQFLHAEIAALVKCRGTKPYKIKIIRVNKKGELRNAKPCPLCDLGIRAAGIRLVEYST